MWRTFLALVLGATAACATAGDPTDPMGPQNGYGAAATVETQRVTGASPAVLLLLFGGENHDVFLGCLTCSEYDAASVRNQIGAHGNAHSGTSILNQFGQYGNTSSALSPCNPHALHAPVIVDREGRYYGELTVNDHNNSRTRIEFLRTWVGAVCSQPEASLRTR